MLNSQWFKPPAIEKCISYRFSLNYKNVVKNERTSKRYDKINRTPMPKTIDLNCDMGEGYDTDELIMPFISSANIACGYHAGDESTIQRTVALALKYNVAVGAHPSYPDKINFGRKEMAMSPEEVYNMIFIQINLVKSIAEKQGVQMHHVKPHGALYNSAAVNPDLASAIVRAIKSIDENLILYGLPYSELEKAALKDGVRFAAEVFSDRTYTDEGRLTPRTDPNAMIIDANDSIHQVLQMINDGAILSTNKKIIQIKANTICIHGDGQHAVEFAEKISVSLNNNNILIQPIK